MLQVFKFQNIEEFISEIKISKLIFSSLILIAAIFAGVCCQINQTEQNASYVKKYLAGKKGYYANLVTSTRRRVTEKYYGTQAKTEEEFSEQFTTDFYKNISQLQDSELKEGVVFMQLKYLNDYFTEILEQSINQETYITHLNRFLDLRFSGQDNFNSIKTQISNSMAAKIDQLLSKERLSVHPEVLANFISPMVEVYYHQLISISHANTNLYQSNSTLHFLILNLPIIVFLIFLIIGYFFYTSVGGRLFAFCFILTFFFAAFLLQAPVSNHNIDLTYSDIIKV
jgi:hypothetical protein